MSEAALRFEVRGVLAGVYWKLTAGTPMLTHAVELDERGIATRVLCKRVLLDSLADGGCPEARLSAPTCKSCRLALRKAGRLP